MWLKLTYEILRIYSDSLIDLKKYNTKKHKEIASLNNYILDTISVQ